MSNVSNKLFAYISIFKKGCSLMAAKKQDAKASKGKTTSTSKDKSSSKNSKPAAPSKGKKK